MNSTRCLRRKMMGRGADGGCGTQEKPCPISRVSTRTLTHQNQNQTLTLDLYTQARKALCDRSPFDSEEAGSRVSTLPVGLAAFLSKYSDRRRKHRKLHPESGAKSTPRAAATNVWTKTEEYFRYIALADVESLVAKSDLALVFDCCFSIPSLPAGVEGNVISTETEVSENVSVAGGLELVTVAQELKNEGQLMEIVVVGASDALLQKGGENLDSSPLALSIDLHWLFGSKHKVLLTSERPSKKRKLLGGEAGLDRLVTVGPFQGGNLVFCHACCLSDCTERSNRFLFCDSCNVCVHQKCYGVQDIPMEGWLCSYCRQRDHLITGSTRKLAESEAVDISSRPCLLCPKEGGALKHVDMDMGKFGNNCNEKFAHLFCSLWMPEMYVENTETMEPVMNIGGIKDTRTRLVCFLCKVKYGVCIRCSHGTCRTSFHPICAREAKLRMEIWGKVGCDNVELRAFCSKHSGSQDTNNVQQSENVTSVGSNSPASKLLPTAAPLNRSHKIKLGRKNKDTGIVDLKSTAGNCDEPNKNEIQLEADASAMKSNSLIPECGDAQLIINMEKPKVTESDNNGVADPTDSFNLVPILKKLINQGKASTNDVASKVGIPSESLTAFLVDEHAPFPTEWRTKLTEWLRNSNDTGISFEAKVSQTDAASDVKVVGLGPDSTGDAPVTALLQRRRVKGKIRILKGNKIVSTSGETCDPQNDNRMLINEISENKHSTTEDTKKGSINNESMFCDRDRPYKELEVTRKACLDLPSRMDNGVDSCKDLVQNILDPPNSLDTESPVKMANNNISEVCRHPQSTMEKELTEGPGNGQADEADIVQNSLVKSSGEHQSSAALGVPDFRNGKSISSSYIHPLINKRLIQMQNCLFLKQNNRSPVSDGQSEKGTSSMGATCSANICCNHQAWHSSCTDMDGTLDDGKGEQLAKARKMGILELSPEDEVEGEILYFQNRLLDNAVANKHHCEDLIFRVVTNLSHDLDELSKQRWDAVLINQYLREVREAKKRGRKERRHREAQAVLAAATAAAAASSRISSFRKDAHDEIATTLNEGPLKVITVCGRDGPEPHSQLLPRAKETRSRVANPKISSGHTEVCQSDFSKEHPLACDVCGRNETILNRVLVCCNCKVSVHLGCYNSSKESVGPWYCELCEELGRDKSCFVAQCGLCSGATGAFRKSTDGQWVHAFCAEWLLKSTFRRGQPNSVEGMECVSRERDQLVCCICHCKHGVCLKCDDDDCQRTFHPICAKNDGLYMNVKSVGGKLLHKAYCENHSLGQREKDESEQYGVEELRRIKQIRVDLEKVRLLCERIIKREKLKREFVLCSHDILASSRDNVAFSVLVRSSFLPPDVSSESVTTSLNGHTDDSKSCSEAIQRSDDITEDSTVSDMCRITLPMHLGIDRKTDDSSTSQRPCTRKPTYMVPFSGKQLPHRPASIASQKTANNRDRRSKSKKYTETFQKEVVMTSDQASMQNQRLPKGYVYVPICSLPKEKTDSRDKGSHESLEPDG